MAEAPYRLMVWRSSAGPNSYGPWKWLIKGPGLGGESIIPAVGNAPTYERALDDGMARLCLFYGRVIPSQRALRRKREWLAKYGESFKRGLAWH